MDFPALAVLQDWAPSTLSEDDQKAIESLNAELHQLLDDVRTARPADGADDESQALLRFVRFNAMALQLLGSMPFGDLQERFNRLSSDLVRRELEAAEAERKLALRHVEQALHRYGVLMVALTAHTEGLSAASMKTGLAAFSQLLASNELLPNSDERIVLRFQLDVLVALDVLDASLEELTFWAFRVITTARRVEAIPIVPTTGLRGELARERARRAWADWDAEDAAKEFAPWLSASQ